MPIYGFECDACGHRFDRLQKLSDADPTVCPQCGKRALRRQLSAPSFRLSGSGWYETDFKKDGEKKHNLADKADGSAAGDKVSEKSSDGAGEKSGDKAAASGTTQSKPAGGEAKTAAPADSAKAAPKPASPPAAD